MNAYGDQGDERRRLGGGDSFALRRLPVSRAHGTAEDEVMTTSDSGLRTAVERARQIADEYPEPYRSLAFSGLLEHLLHSGTGDAESRRGATPAPAGPPATDMPITEFLAQRRLDSHPDRVVAIAYYYFHRENGKGVTTKELVDAYARSRAKRPQNYPDVIASCVRKGYLIDGGRRDGLKTWVITRTGEAHLEQDM